MCRLCGTLPLTEQRSYDEQTVDHIVPLAADKPWFAAWYADWQAELADLAGPRTGAKPG